MLAEFGGKGEC